MKLRFIIALVCTLLTVAACVVEPIGYDGRRDYGHRVWRE